MLLGEELCANKMLFQLLLTPEQVLIKDPSILFSRTEFTG
jgi:hypothetical protein